MQVLSSLSGITFYAPSAGHAPTNSADVSAIASAYQVVSATATQLYAGSAYLTSVNEAPLSATRAGNAANASMANSAYYDGTGRLISALPDRATVSAIASSYAESAASSKQDTLTFGYNTANQISSIDGSALGGMDEAAVSGIASAYAESAVSSVSGNYYPATSNPSGYLTAQAQASWSESASASPSYIQDKPDLVDIVAGPGIVVDNPDGNTLRVSMAADYEVVLWETNSSGVDSGSITVSEAITNFEKYEIYGFETERGGTFVNTFAYSQIPFDYPSIITKPNDNNGSYAFSINMFCAGNISQWRQTYFGCRCHWNSTFTEMTIDSNHGAFVNKDANGTFNSINQKLRITKIVGIHRIANN